MQLTMDLEQNELQDRYLQAKELVIRFLNGDENVAQDAAKWVEFTNKKHAEQKQHAGAHILVNSSNIKRISFYENDPDQLVVEFNSGGTYAYSIPDVVTYRVDGKEEAYSPWGLFNLLAEENRKKSTGEDPVASVSGLFNALIKPNPNRVQPIPYKRVG